MRKSVLIIDDDPQERDVLCRILRRKSIYTETAPDFATGKAMAGQARQAGTKFDVILLDLSLPDAVDPYVTLARSVELGEKVIPFTGVEDPALIRQFQQRQLPFILKGTPGPELIKTILTELEWQEPDEETERAILDAHNDSKKTVTELNWFRRNAPTIGAAAGLASILLCVVTLTAKARGGVKEMLDNAKGGALTEQGIRQSLANHEAALAEGKAAREKIASEQKQFREENEKKFDVEFEKIHAEIGILHQENERSKVQREDTQRDVSEVKRTTQSIYEYLLNHKK